MTHRRVNKSMEHFFLLVLFIADLLFDPVSTMEAANWDSSNAIHGLLSKFPTSSNKEVSNSKMYQNYMFSPLSASILTSMLLPGAMENSGAELRKGLHLQEKDDLSSILEQMSSLMETIEGTHEGFTLKIANKLYAAKNVALKSEYNANITKFFKSSTEQIDFASANKAATAINTWVNTQTNKKISRIISPVDLDELTRLILINAVYFKAEWTNKFPKDKKNFGDFFFRGRGGEVESKQVQKMQKTMTIPYKHFGDTFPASVACLPYKNKGKGLDRFYMVIILPNEMKDMEAVESELGKEEFTFQAIFEKVIPESQLVSVVLPKFKLESIHDFVPIFQNLGVQEIFSTNANLGGMSEEKDLYVSKIVQKAFISVDEDGTEAAAVSAAQIQGRAALADPTLFDVKHTFIAYIFDEKTKCTLFVTKIQTISNFVVQKK